MKIKINIEKKHLYVFAIIATLLVAGVFAAARFSGTSGVGHDSNEIGVTINGQTIPLQQAIDQKLIGGGTSLQTVSNTCSGTTVCKAFCPAGTTALSGSCVLQSPGSNTPLQNMGLEPASAGTTGSTGWSCAYSTTANILVQANCGGVPSITTGKGALSCRYISQLTKVTCNSDEFLTGCMNVHVPDGQTVCGVVFDKNSCSASCDNSYEVQAVCCKIV